MAKSGMKFKTNLRSKLEEESKKEGGQNEKDKRVLNYYDMDFGEKMSVIVLPDASGELWYKYKKHGPNLQTRGVSGIGCLNDRDGGGGCPACQQAYDLLDLHKDTGDESYKSEAKKWFPRKYTIMNVVVVDSSVTVQESDDGNQAKIFYVPMAIEKMIMETITEGILDEDDLLRTPLVIKKTKNQGDRADYSSSYFSRKPLSDEDFEVFDDFKIEPYDLENIDIVPSIPSEEELNEWIEDAKKKMKNKKENSEGESKSSSKEGSALDRLKNKRKSDDSESESEPSSEEEEEKGQEEKEEKAKDDSEESKPSGESVRDRLARLRS